MYMSSAWLNATRGAHFLSARLIITRQNRRITTEMISDIATRSVPSATISSYSFQMQTTGISSAPIKSARQEIPVVGGRDGDAAARPGAGEASLLAATSRRNCCCSIELMYRRTVRQV